MGLRKVISRGRFIIGLIIGIVLTGSVAYSANIFNTPETGYLLCVNQKTKIITYPATQKCPSGTSKLILGARGAQGTQGIQGEKGEKGDLGPQGIQGITGEMGPQGERGLTGPQGIQGPQGSTTITQAQPIVQKVYDANGNLMGNLLGTSAGDVTVQVGNSRFSYFSSGFIVLNGQVLYTDANCAGPRYAELYRGEVSSWTINAPFVSVPGIDPSRNSAGLFVGTSTGNELPVPTSAFRLSFDNAGALSCTALSSQSLSGLSAIILLAPLNLNVPVRYPTPFSIRSS
jgi:hypothetical protein